MYRIKFNINSSKIDAVVFSSSIRIDRQFNREEESNYIKVSRKVFDFLNCHFIYFEFNHFYAY